MPVPGRIGVELVYHLLSGDLVSSLVHPAVLREL